MARKSQNSGNGTEAVAVDPAVKVKKDVASRGVFGIMRRLNMQFRLLVQGERNMEEAETDEQYQTIFAAHRRTEARIFKSLLALTRVSDETPAE